MEFTAESVTWAEEVLRNAGTIFAQTEINRFFGTSAAVAAAAGTPPADDLNTMLSTIAKAPGVSTTVTIPEAPAGGDASLLRDAQMLDSYISVLTALVMYHNHPSPYDLSDGKQAAQFVTDVANARNLVVTGGTDTAIRKYLTMTRSVRETLNVSTTPADLHMELLTAMFGDLGLPENIFKGIDGVLTEIAESLKNLQLSFETPSQTLNHFANFYHLVPVPGSNPVINQMDAELIYMQLAQHSWNTAAGKSSVSHFSLDATLTRATSTMNAGVVEANSSSIADSLMQLTRNDAANIADQIGRRAIREEEELDLEKIRRRRSPTR